MATAVKLDSAEIEIGFDAKEVRKELKLGAYDVEEKTGTQLAKQLAYAEALKAHFEDTAKRCKTALVELHNDEITKAMEAKPEGERYGTFKIPVKDNNRLELEYTVPKKVDWDQNELKKSVDVIKNDWAENPDEFVETIYNVPEAKWKAWPNAIKNVFLAARTTKPGSVSVKINDKAA